MMSWFVEEPDQLFVTGALVNLYVARRRQDAHPGLGLFGNRESGWRNRLMAYRSPPTFFRRSFKHFAANRFESNIKAQL